MLLVYWCLSLPRTMRLCFAVMILIFVIHLKSNLDNATFWGRKLYSRSLSKSRYEMNNKGLEEDEELVPANRLLVVKYTSCWKTCIKKTLESKPMGHGLPLKKIFYLYLQFHHPWLFVTYCSGTSNIDMLRKEDESHISHDCVSSIWEACLLQR